MDIIEKALQEGRTTLSEYESKQLLIKYGIPVTRESLAVDREQLLGAINDMGFPIVLKSCSPAISHKTEKDLVKLDIRTEAEALEAFGYIMENMEGPEKAVLVQEMVKGKRELVVGLTRDLQFGPCVMFGLGGIFTEILEDISFRVAPLQKKDAMEMIQEIKGRKILEPIRGMKPVNMDALVDILIKVGNIGVENDSVKEIDINPLIISGGDPVSVDALVVLEAADL